MVRRLSPSPGRAAWSALFALQVRLAMPGALRFGFLLHDLTEGLVDLGAHHLVEGGDQGLGRHRAHPVEGLVDVGPVRLGAPGIIEWLPDLLQEEANERLRDRFGVAADLFLYGESCWNV